MKETPLFVDQQGAQLFAIWHEPDGPTTRTPFVFCHPFAEEKLWTQRVFVAFARRLAAEGHHVLRFDYRGNGDSDGRFEESSLTTALADTRRAIDYVRGRTGASVTNLLGLRLGATVASLAAEEVEGIEQLILWSPIVDGARYMQEVLRVNLALQMALHKEIALDRVQLADHMQRGHTVNIDGYELGYPLFSEVSAVRLHEGSKRHSGPCLIVQIDPRPARPQPELEQLASGYRQAVLSTVQEDPFWKEIPRFYNRADQLFAATLDWQSRLAGALQS